ncbi:MAG: hypothetical protein V1750_08645, partial [Acidobacteriota bacterium]
YEMLSGRRPFEGDTPVAILMAILNQPAAPFPPNTPVAAPVAQILNRLLEKSAARRYPSAGALLDDLEVACFELGVSLSSGTRRPIGGATPSHQTGRSPLPGAADRPPHLTRSHARAVVLRWRVLVAAALAVVALGLTLQWLSQKTRAIGHGDAVLVLPLAAAGDLDRRNLAGVVTGQLVDSLSRAGGLRVLALPEGEAASGVAVGDLARRGGARWGVDGNLFLDGGRLALTVKLTERAAARVIWSETVRGPLDEVFAMAARQASGAAGALGVYMTASRLEFPGEQAFDDFARGSLALASYDPGQIDTAVSLLERCIAAAPRFAPAYPRLARALLQYRNLGIDYSPAYLDRAGAAIRAGLEVDPGDVEMRANLGWLRLYTYDFRGAHEAATSLGTHGGGTASGCKLVVWDQFLRGETASALASVRQCRATFPLDSSILLNLVVLNAMVGNSEAALAAARDTEEIHSSALVTALSRSWLDLARGESHRAASDLRDAFRRSGALILGLQAAQAALVAGDYPLAEEGLAPWLAKNPYSLEAHWMRCLTRELAGDASGAQQAAAEASRWTGELDRRYHNPTTRLAAAYYAARAGARVDANEVAAVDVRDQALLAAWLQQVTLARLGVRDALDRPVTPYSPTFWLNRFASLELELLRAQ